ncbi:hypothetical protein E0485_14510 [Paenibacillus albiflavus]|uniref:Uncharacterized protein n=1 Tax=Paenibacillus albiflavus TaxID=2545760 RepID=A0A4R4E994_9BACL|nr:hypothetical protein [Paenibacillus albiflavus]TCZ76404.1 hypothetical protein E0485_14510 [Paenibacillus albiflavus]
MNNEFICDCPLLKIRIDEGACYDINAVVEKWAKENILKIIEKQFQVRIDVSKAKEVCSTCKHYPFDRKD